MVLPFLKKQKYHMQPPATTITTTAPSTHHRTPVTPLFEEVIWEEVLTSLPDASNSSNPAAAEETSEMVLDS